MNGVGLGSGELVRRKVWRALLFVVFYLGHQLGAVIHENYPVLFSWFPEQLSILFLFKLLCPDICIFFLVVVAWSCFTVMFA